MHQLEAGGTYFDDNPQVLRRFRSLFAHEAVLRRHVLVTPRKRGIKEVGQACSTNRIQRLPGQ